MSQEDIPTDFKMVKVLKTSSLEERTFKEADKKSNGFPILMTEIKIPNRDSHPSPLGKQGPGTERKGG